MSGHFLFHLLSPGALFLFCFYNLLSFLRLVGISFFLLLQGCRLTCPNSLLFWVRSLRPCRSILALSFHLFLPFPFIFPSQTIILSHQLPTIYLTHDLYTDLHFNYCSLFFFFYNLRLLPTPALSFVSFLLISVCFLSPSNRPKKKTLLPAHDGTDSCGPCGFVL